MAMCKECGDVVSAEDIANGICKTCINSGIEPEPTVVQKKEEVKTVDFGNPFSFRGRSSRLDYLVYGVLLSYALMLLGVYIGVQLEKPAVIFAFVIVGAVSALASIVRRVRDREESILLVIILSLIPYVGFFVLIYLLLAPGKREEESMQTDNKIEENELKGVTVAIE
jgi:uncharacterized membrane protein YhaH (DUF805 family)